MTTWNSTTPNLKGSIQKLLDDATFETSDTMVDYLLPWANRIVQEICTEVNIRAHLTSDTTSMVFTTSDEAIALPTNYLKMSERFTKVRYSDTVIPIIGLEQLRAYDPANTETTANAYPDYVAIEGGYMYPYPLFAGTIVIENYYRVPTDMVNTTDNPDLPIDNLRTDLIIAGVCGKYGFPHLNEKELAAQYYNRSVFPHRGQFFELLELYKTHLGGTDSVWSNRAKFY